MADSGPFPLGINGGDVVVDETYVGGKPRFKGQSRRGRGTNKQPVMALVERGGSVKTKPITHVNAKTLKGMIREHVHPSARILTDDNLAYRGIWREYERGHAVVNHSHKEYARGDVHSNTVEGFFAIVKRGLNGIYHSVSREHLLRYLAEFEFRYNHREATDGERTALAIRATEGKRLFYKESARI